MKLFLTSQGIPAAFRQMFVELIGKNGEEIKVAYVPDAADIYSSDEKRPWFDEAFGDLKATGVKIVEVHFADYDGRTEELRRVLRNVDAVWVVGGNPHYLRYVMRTSGFDDMVWELVDNGLVYAGFSAGAMVAGTTIQYADLDGELHKEPVRIDRGLGLVDRVIVPHWNQAERRLYLNPSSSSLSKGWLGDYSVSG